MPSSPTSPTAHSPDLNGYRQYYFVGIGGIGMSALARWFSRQGRVVFGYDRTPTPLTEALVTEGMTVTYTDTPETLPKGVVEDREGTLVVFTPAVPEDHQQMAWLRDAGYRAVKRAELLGATTRAMPKVVAVAGTHGKTTTSALVAHLLEMARMPLTAFVGGVMKGYDSNLIGTQPDADSLDIGEDGQGIVVVEADEYDRSFLHLHPTALILTSLDADHLDIYGTPAALEDSYRAFVGQIREGGLLMVSTGAAARLGTATLQRVSRVITYGVGAGDVHAGVPQAEGPGWRFTLHHPDLEAPIEDLFLPMAGRHNLENALAAASLGLHLGLTPGQIREGLMSFPGVERRFEVHVDGPDHVLVDDYAHHPSELEAFIEGVRLQYPGRHLTVAFQPHLYSRTRDFAEGFARALAKADRLILLDIYPARELPIPGVTSAMIGGLIPSGGPDVVYTPLSGALERLTSLPDTDILATVGAGDIVTLVAPLTAWARSGALMTAPSTL